MWACTRSFEQFIFQLQREWTPRKKFYIDLMKTRRIWEMTFAASGHHNPFKENTSWLKFSRYQTDVPTSQTCGCWESTRDNRCSHSSADRRVCQPLCDLKIFKTLIKWENQSADNLLNYTDKNPGRFIEVWLISISQILVDLCDNWTQFQKAVALPFVRVPTWRSWKVSRAKYQTQLKLKPTSELDSIAIWNLKNL